MLNKLYTKEIYGDKIIIKFIDGKVQEFCILKDKNTIVEKRELKRLAANSEGIKRFFTDASCRRGYYAEQVAKVKLEYLGWEVIMAPPSNPGYDILARKSSNELYKKIQVKYLNNRRRVKWSKEAKAKFDVLLAVDQNGNTYWIDKSELLNSLRIGPNSDKQWNNDIKVSSIPIIDQTACFDIQQRGLFRYDLNKFYNCKNLLKGDNYKIAIPKVEILK